MHSPFKYDSPKSPFYDHKKIDSNTIFNLSGKNEGKFKKRTRQMIPDLYWSYFKPGDAIGREDFYRRLLMLFKPWRDESKFKDENANYEETWNNYLQSIDEIFLNDVQTFLGNFIKLRDDETQLFKYRRRIDKFLDSGIILNTMNDDEDEETNRYRYII
jgi:hypothetical protein